MFKEKEIEFRNPLVFSQKQGTSIIRNNISNHVRSPSEIGAAIHVDKAKKIVGTINWIIGEQPGHFRLITPNAIQLAIDAPGQTRDPVLIQWLSNVGISSYDWIRKRGQVTMMAAWPICCSKPLNQLPTSYGMR